MNGDLNISNYCALFMDLLGQRDALKGEGLIPVVKSDDEHTEFINKVKLSVGAINSLQKRVDEFLCREGQPSIRELLSSPDKKIYDEMKTSRAKRQRWSDGLVFFASLNEEVDKCPMNALYEIFTTAGVFCFAGLAGKQPLRGAIDIAWGVELHENELYGAVVARSYELESEVAQYPRIVIGPRTVEYLSLLREQDTSEFDKFALLNKTLAQLCWEMIAVDTDGNHILDYLGRGFTDSVTHSTREFLYGKAYEFIVEQEELHKETNNNKLAARYAQLKDYYDSKKIP